MKYRHFVLPATFISALFMALASTAQIPVPQPTLNAPSQKLQSFKFEGADLDTVMGMYSEWTGKIYLKNDAVKATITLKADRLTIPECIEVVDAILAMNNIVLVPMGDKFLKVVQANAPDLGGQGLSVSLNAEQVHASTDKLVTQLVPLNNVSIPDVQTAVQHLMHAFGKIQTLERSNSMLITDTASNIKRIRELIDFMDQATARIEPRIYQIQYADAAEISSRLNEIIIMAQSDQATTARASSVRTPPGVLRARTTTTARTTPTQATISKTESSQTEIIQGVVKVMADDRTNILIIFSLEENFEFFDKIIKVLDVEVDPAITFEVVNLEYADAEELSGTLNELVGAAQSARSSTSGSSSTSTRSAAGMRATPSQSASTQRVTPNATAGNALQSLSKLSEDTKILADKRSNSIVLMGGTTDIAAIKQVISSLDVMLEQVIIEAAIFEVTLDDTLNHGISWLHNRENTRVGAWDGANLGGTNAFGIMANALTYYRSFPDLNVTAAVNLSKEDDNVRLLQNPIIMTTDNTEASIKIGEQKPVVTSTDSSLNSTQLRSSYEYKDIGIQLTVTPRINPQGYVVMEVSQKADQLGPDVTIDNNNVPTVFNREFEATIAVPNKSTVVLGGMVRNKMTDNVDKIPILGDIPLIGRYLFSNVTKKNEARELIVLLTPSVLSSIEESENEAGRLYRSTDIVPEDWPINWSASKLQHIPEDSEPMDESYESSSAQQAVETAPLPASEPTNNEVESTSSAVSTSSLPEPSDQDKAELIQLLDSISQ